MTGIRILVVDDHAATRSGLNKFFMVNKDLVPVGEATDSSEALEMVATHRPDVILMELMMRGMDGIAMTREIHEKYPPAKIIALTSFSEKNLVQGALRAGASGYLVKNITASELGRAIRSAHAGYMPLSPEAAQAIG